MDGVWGDLALFAAAFGFGVGSAVLPVILNAELYVIGMAALLARDDLLVAVLCLVAGTVLGKAIVFELIRMGVPPRTRSVLGGGSTRWRFGRSVDRKPPTHRVTRMLRRWGDRLLALLSHRYLGSATVLVSSSVSVPPLAVVTVLAAASRQPLWLFLLMVGAGRTAQFVTLAFLVHSVTP